MLHLGGLQDENSINLVSGIQIQPTNNLLLGGVLSPRNYENDLSLYYHVLIGYVPSWKLLKFSTNMIQAGMHRYRFGDNGGVRWFSFSVTEAAQIGNLNLTPSKFFDLNYQFSLDKNLDKSNYNLIKTDININNFVTSFEFLEEDNYLSQDSYLSNTTKFNFDKNKSLSFGTSKNLDKNITNYYNIIYEYQNDCLTAALEYNKNYYTDGDLKPEENLLFSIKIIPFGKITSPNINK